MKIKKFNTEKEGAARTQAPLPQIMT